MLHTTASAGTQVRAFNSSLYRYYVLGILTLVGVFSWMDRQLFSILLESIKRDLRLSDTQLGLLGGIAFGLFYATVGLPLARLADRVNRRNLIVATLGLWSAMTGLSGAATGFFTMFLTRVGVGIGEAGSTPASQSMVSDYFPANVRGLAMGVLYTFVPLGYIFAYATGGWLNDTVGWRAAFLLFGVPGLLLAVWIRMTVKEPRRGQSESLAHPVVAPPGLTTTLRSFLSRRSLRHIPLAGALHGLGAFGASVWVPAYFMRAHHMTSFEIGSRLAILMGTAGIIGVLFGGALCDRLVTRTRNPRWYMWIPGASVFVSIPFLILAFSTSNPVLALVFYAVPVFCNHIVLGPIVASMQALAGVNQRAQIAAFYLFLVNLVSMGFGPLVIGMLSDFLQARLGNGALQYSLMSLTTITCALASLHLFLASRAIASDLPRNGES